MKTHLLRARLGFRNLTHSGKNTLFPWGVLLLVLAVALAGCQSADEELRNTPAGDEAAGERATILDAELADGQLFTVGFTPDGHAFKGNPEASVLIEEYSSYQCPFCSRFFNEIYSDVMSRYVETGQALYVFKDFPLSGQPQSPKAAEAARCAGEVAGAQAFWDMHDRLFTGQGEWSGSSSAEEIFKGYAGTLGVPQAAFDECLDSGRTADQVQADADEGLTRGVRGTPSFFINGQILVGAQPISAFAVAIDRALAGEPVAPSATSEGAAADSGGSEPPLEALVPTPVAFAFENDKDSGVLFALGDPQAPVTFVEFTDFQCPYCLRYFQETWPALKEQFIDTGRIFYVFKDFPLTSIHPEALKAHEAARCAFDLGGESAYWPMHDRLFEGQAEWSGNAEHGAVFKAYAGELGLDQGRFDSCLDSGQHAEAVQADVNEGFNLGVNGTPTFFVGGFPFSGAHPIENFEQIITLAENGQLRDAIAQAIAAARAQQEAQQQPRPTIAPADVPLGDAPIKGDPDAPVTIVEYSDYQCPFCARYVQDTMSQLIKNYVETGKVRYVFKDFPLTSIHPQAVKAAEATRCAREVGGEGAYWQMHDKLFGEQEQWSGDPEHAAVFKGYAGGLELDQAAFDDCLDSGRYESAVMADLQEGAGLGVSGTPAFFVNGQPLEGAQPYDVFVQVIEQFLAGD